MMLRIILWLIAVGLSAVPLWILWRAGKKASSLDFRIMQNDSTLLEEDGIIISQMTGLPAGAQVTKDANIVMVPAQSTQPNGATPEEYA